MRWIEVIKIQTGGCDQESLERQITELISKIDNHDGMKGIKLYHSAQVNSELCIHLYWESEKAEVHGSAAGLCIIHLLKEFGLVSLSVWVEGI
jgi:heme-degrading monooxygenase HmoA